MRSTRIKRIRISVSGMLFIVHSSNLSLASLPYPLMEEGRFKYLIIIKCITRVAKNLICVKLMKN